MIKYNADFGSTIDGVEYLAYIDSEFGTNCTFYWMHIRRMEHKTFLGFKYFQTKWEYKYCMGYWECFKSKGPEYKTINGNKYFDYKYVKAELIKGILEYRNKQENESNEISIEKDIKHKIRI